MKRKQLRFVVGSLAILLTLTYLGFSGFQESKAYYQTVPELYAAKDSYYDQLMKVEGDVVAGSIVREGKAIKFVIGDKLTLPVVYVGTCLLYTSPSPRD